MFRAAPVIGAPNGNCPNDPNRRTVTHSMEYATAMTRNKPQIQAAVWMNLTNIWLSERSQTLKTEKEAIPQEIITYKNRSN